MTRGLGGNSPANVQKYLSGVNYPAKKQDLVEAARRNDAPDEVMQTIGKLPEDHYGGPQDVMKGYGEIE
ncbi:DUF2795 domain-containing protein [Frateuria sp. MAH-13]|uniref:DUF2795 domain-containing protein n=1 Tax=Frateuria flava TaxID=2821489 RepID=A0ABS4DKR6_9GAMM|nr:DUF2795 domain-containing protein [Frateuria flava]MBP1473647.1 DUF2795 domain-containing protein [Frateuria flava]